MNFKRLENGRLDLSQFDDETVMEAMRNTIPEFIEILSGMVSQGLTDNEILLKVCTAGGSPQAMRLGVIVLRSIRKDLIHNSTREGE